MTNPNLIRSGRAPLFPTGRIGQVGPMLDERMTRAAMFVNGLYRDEAKGWWHEGPIGTAFLVGVRSEQWDRTYGYLVTASHVLLENRDQAKDMTISLRRNDTGELFTFPTRIADWRSFADRGLDLAVTMLASVEAPVQETFRAASLDLKGLMLDESGSVSEEDRESRLHLGGPVFYFGLLHPLQEMAASAIPMVRSGTIGWLDLPHLRYDLTAYSGETDEKYDYTGHLIDCRTYNGFSGSPVLAQFPMVDGTYDAAGALTHIGLNYPVRLLGMLTTHLTDTPTSSDAPVSDDANGARFGVATVLPVEYIREVIVNDPDFAEDRKERDEAGGEGGIGPSPFTPDVRGSTPKADVADRDEPVSLAPLTGDQALRALLDTPPDPKA